MTRNDIIIHIEDGRLKLSADVDHDGLRFLQAMCSPLLELVDFQARLRNGATEPYHVAEEPQPFPSVT